ncbi:MAG TPA: YceD family protein [Candidatus Limnocylindrales bacterium]
MADLRPLTWNVAALLSEPLGSTRDHDVAGVTIPLPDDLRLDDPIQGHVRLTRTNRGLLVTAALEASLDAECSRCLRAIEVPIELRIEEEALPSLDPDGQPIDRAGEPDILRLNDHHELELEPSVADAISLAEPIAPVCRPDCPGLCAVCGEPMETGDHRHDEDEVDPRLAALLDFRPAEQAESSPGPVTDERRARSKVDGRTATR